MTGRLLRGYFAANVALGAVLVAIYPFQEPGSAAAVITVAALAVVGTSLVVSGALLYLDVEVPWPGAG